MAQLPDFYNFDSSKTDKYVDGDRKPIFPFGYGLSYTTFRYANLEVKTPPVGSSDDVLVTVDVSNTGSLEGDEVAQLYLHHDVSSVEQPDRALKGFQRIRLKPNETKSLEFIVKSSDLAVWSKNHSWLIEPGPYTIFVGGSSLADLSAHFSLKARN